MTTETWQLFQGGRPLSRPLLVDPEAYEPFTVGRERALDHRLSLTALARGGAS